MLETVVIDFEASMSENGKAVLAAWSKAKVVHIQGPDPSRDLRQFYDELLTQIGRAVPLAEDARISSREAQRTGELWMEVRYDPSIPNAYRHSSGPQPLHTDGSYIANYPGATLMYCLQAASEGGETTFIDGEVLVDIISRKQPALSDQLRRRPVRHSRSGDDRVQPVVSSDDEGVLLNWNYFCVDRTQDPEVLDLAQRFLDFLAADRDVHDATLAVPLAPGEAVVWKDDRVLHGRNGFEAHAASERFIWKCAVAVGADKR